MGGGAVCMQELAYGRRENGEESRKELKRDFHHSVADTEPDLSPNKKQAKEVSNDEVFSEVSDPTVSSMVNALTFQDIGSQPTELENISQEECGEVTSTCLENSSSEETLSNDKNTSSAAMTSCVILEIPKHASSSGIRKITFKFSKKKEDYNCQSPAPYGFHEDNDESLPKADCNSGSSGYIQAGDYNLYTHDIKLKMSKKVVSTCYPTNVKKLLTSGILDGAIVKYIYNSGEVELPGVIDAGGYLCGCSMCNYSRVLSAYEFEQHAGVKTRHPNNHIYLENGRPVYSIIQEMKTAPTSLLDEVIKNVAGSSLNEESFQVWKEKLLQNRGKMGTDTNLIGASYKHKLSIRGKCKPFLLFAWAKSFWAANVCEKDN